MSPSGEDRRGRMVSEDPEAEERESEEGVGVEELGETDMTRKP
jgi:hypothetical protein